MTKTYNPDDAFDIELNGIDGLPLFNDDGSAMTISVLGAESDVAVKHAKELTTRYIAKAGKHTGESLDAEIVQKISKLTVAWNITPSKMIPGYDPGLGEGKAELTPAAASKFYSDRFFRSFRDAADAGINERANFLRG